MQQFVEGVQCRRVVLDREIDSRTDRVKCKVGEERCNVYRGGPRGVKRSRVSIGHAGRE